MGSAGPRAGANGAEPSVSGDGERERRMGMNGDKGARIWLASYPRSGNTLMRAILYQCFGVSSTSVHVNDLGGLHDLERYVGHFETAGDCGCGTCTPLVVKTHHPPPDAGPAIYVVRDGRAAAVSLWEFYGRCKTLREVIAGGSHFGFWADHVEAWRPWARPRTLLVRYEDMTGDLPGVLAALGAFLGLPATSREAPSRAYMAAVGGRWVREFSDWRGCLDDRDLRLFRHLGGRTMARLGYRPEQQPGRGARAVLQETDAWCAARYWRLRRSLGRFRQRRAAPEL